MTQPPEAGDLRRLLSEATQGPWMVQDGCSWRRIGTHFHDGDVLCPIVQRDGHPDLIAADGKRDANLRLIVAAVNALPGLLGELAALRSQAALSPAPSQGDVDQMKAALVQWFTDNTGFFQSESDPEIVQAYYGGNWITMRVDRLAAAASAAMPVSAGYREGIEAAAKVAENAVAPTLGGAAVRDWISAAIRALSNDDGKEGR